jgi:D-glycero-D-manno-heptose 1,7-bisphosphate phosphatase
MRPAVFLDRDGVLIAGRVLCGRPVPFDSDHSQFEFLEGVREACLALRSCDALLVMVTNQPDIARGKIELISVQKVNTDIRDALCLDDVRLCPHDGDCCECRKPKPGMILDSARHFGVDLSRSVMVGDRWRDIAAGVNAGVKTVFVDHHYDEEQPERPDFICHSLFEAVPFIKTIIRLKGL